MPTPQQLAQVQVHVHNLRTSPTGSLKRPGLDNAFLRELVRNPRKTLAAELGMKIPASANVKVIQELPDDYKLVILWAGRASYLDETSSPG